MAFNNEIRVLTTEDTNHADNFNEPMQQLLENTQFNAKQIDVLNTNVGDTSTLKTSSKEVVGAINENADEITDLQGNIARCVSNVGGDKFLTEDILSNAGYLQSYVGSANNSATMPNTGQWRVMYIPYVSPIEGYSIHVAYGCVGNEDVWYRKSNGLVWQKWKQLSTTDKVDILLIPATGYKITLDHSYKMNNLLFVNIEVKTSDGSSFPLNSELRVVSYPVNLVKNINTSLCSSGIKNGYLKPNTSAFSYVNGSIYATTSVDVDTLRISGFVDLI